MDMRHLIFFLLFILASKIHAHPAYGIIVDKHRNVYFADIHHNGIGSVWKLNNNGRLELLLSDFHAHNIALDDEGNIYTAHGEGDHTMVRISKNGIDTLYRTFDHEHFFGGNATYGNDEIYFGINHFVWRIRNGKREKLSDHYLEWNQSMYVDPEGMIYATDKASYGGCIVKITPEGESEIIAKNLITKLNRPVDKHNDVILGITKGCDGYMYAAETAGRRVLKINKDGSNRSFYSPKDGWSPVGLDFFSGDAYILEYNLETNEGPRITVIRENGSSELLFEYGK